MTAVAFAPPGLNLDLERAVLRHVRTAPVTPGQIARWTGFRYEDIRGALFSLRLSGLIRRRRGPNGRGWEWYCG